MSNKNIYPPHQAIVTGTIPLRSLHALLERLTQQWLEREKKGQLQPKRHHAFLMAYHKTFQVKNRVIAITPHGKALSLLRSQFAKKPKNPV